MKFKKFVNIDIDGEGNIGVIDLGELDLQAIGIENTLKRTVESKIIPALESHFDCPVKIRLTEVISTFGIIHVKTIVVVEGEGGDYEETVDMEETWVY
jgi:hypothetical protein